ncbi:MAG: GPW/gp25 family protein [Chitinophagaceae bacterium]
MAEEVTSIYDNPYTLMSRETGKDITEFNHLLQSVVDILTTPIGSRIDAPEYGANIFELFDRPMGPQWIALANYYAVIALDRWEPRLKILKIQYKMVNSKAGRIVIDLWGAYLLGGRALKFQDVELDFKKTYFTK